MHPKALARMQELIQGAVAAFFETGIGSTGKWHDAESVAKLAGFIEDEFSEYTSNGIHDVFLSMLEACLDRNLYETGTLIPIANYREHEKAIAEAVSAFWQSFPRTYLYRFPLQQVAASFPVLPEIVLADGITLDPVGDLRANKLAGALDFATVAANPTLAIAVAGISIHALSADVCSASAIRTCKVIVALGLVLKVLQRNYASVNRISRASQIDRTNGHLREFDLPADFAGVLSGLAFDPRFLRSEGTLLTPVKDYTPNEIHAFLSVQFSAIGAVVSGAATHSARSSDKKVTVDDKAKNEHCSRIATAAEWFFDSTTSGTSAMGYVQLAIAFEALYGGSQGEPVVRTIGNRLAYSLGRTAQLRHSLLKDFTGFYDRRSDIVHSGASRLTASDAGRFHWGQFTIEQALRHELRMVAK